MKMGRGAVAIGFFLAMGLPVPADAGLNHYGYLTDQPATERKPPTHKDKKAKRSRQASIKPVEPGWPAVPTSYASLANLAPGLLPFFNNGPVFGLPGTVTGDIWSRTQLTGDWGGVRTDWARHGVFVTSIRRATIKM